MVATHGSSVSRIIWMGVLFFGGHWTRLEASEEVLSSDDARQSHRALDVWEYFNGYDDDHEDSENENKATHIVEVEGTFPTVCSVDAVAQSLSAEYGQDIQEAQAFLEQHGFADVEWIRDECHRALTVWRRDQMVWMEHALDRTEYFTSMLFFPGSISPHALNYLNGESDFGDEHYQQHLEEMYGRAKSEGIQFPPDTVNILDDHPEEGGCLSQTVMCCHTHDDVTTDNTNICYYHGYYFDDEFHEDNDEFLTMLLSASQDPASCHGFTWAGHEAYGTDDLAFDLSRMFLGNTLFEVIVKEDLMHHGHERRIDYAPVCQCLEKMPVVSHADCTESTVDNVVMKLYFNDRKRRMWARVESLNIETSPCQNGGLRQQWEAAVAQYPRENDDEAESEARDIVEGQLIPEGTCRARAESFLQSHPHLGSASDLPPASYETTPTTVTSKTNRRLYAHANEKWVHGIGTKPTGAEIPNDQLWHLEPVDECPSRSRDQAGVHVALPADTTCYIIVNSLSQRRLYAEALYLEDDAGIGAAPSSQYKVWDDQKWYFQRVNHEDDSLYYIINAYTRRRLRALTHAQGVHTCAATSRAEDPAHDDSLHWSFGAHKPQHALPVHVSSASRVNDPAFFRRTVPQ